jgi:hypothetical protein
MDMTVTQFRMLKNWMTHTLNEIAACEEYGIKGDYEE